MSIGDRSVEGDLVSGKMMSQARLESLDRWVKAFRAGMFSVVLCIVIATVIIGCADFLFSAEGDVRLSIAIVVWGWAIAVGVVWIRHSVQRNRGLGRNQFGLRAFMIAFGLAPAALYWMAAEISQAQYRRSLLEDFQARGGNTYLDKVQVVPFWAVTGTWLVVPTEGFDESDIAKLKEVFPQGCVIDGLPPAQR